MSHRDKHGGLCLFQERQRKPSECAFKSSTLEGKCESSHSKASFLAISHLPLLEHPLCARHSLGQVLSALYLT